jgi:phage terminase large subunit
VNGHTGRRRIHEAFPPQLWKRWNDDDMFIELVNGSTFQLIGSDRYDSTVGSGPKGIAYSEWALSNPSAWAYHSPMIRESGGFAAFITTPRGNNHAKTMLDKAKGNTSWFHQVLSITDTQALSKDDIAEALQEYQDLHGADLGLAIFEQEYLCSFSGAMVGSYWGSEMAAAEREGRFKPVEIDRTRPVHTIWDLGKAINNPIWCIQIDGPRINVVDFYRPDSDDLGDWCIWLNDRGYHGVDYVPDDVMDPVWGTKLTRWDMLKAKGRKPKLVKRVAVADGIHAGRETIKVATFHQADDERGERVQLGIDGLKNYRREWDDDLKRFRDNAFKDWAEHIGSSWRYLGLAWRKEAPPLPPKENKTTSIYEAKPDGTIHSNLSVREAVEAMVRRRAGKRR